MKFADSALENKLNAYWNKVIITADIAIKSALNKRAGFIQPVKESFERCINDYCEAVDFIISSASAQLGKCTDADYIENYINTTTMDALTDFEEYKSLARQLRKPQSTFMVEIIDACIYKYVINTTRPLYFNDN